VSWDTCLALRAATVGGVVTLVALLIIASTDAGGTWPSRLAMAAALTAPCGAVGTLAAVRLAAAQGELRALAALGVDPARAVLGAALGGMAIGAAGFVLVSSSAADVGALFPHVATHAWRADGAGMRELYLGVHVGPGEVLAVDQRLAVVARLPGSITIFARAAIAAAALACPAWIASPGISLVRRCVVSSVAVTVGIFAFQAAAAGRVPSAALGLAPLLLLGDALAARYVSAKR
jgi:hypothetical protein